LDHRLHLPAARDEHAPLLVALHGCRQDAEDFAHGTRFDVLAERHGLIVVYPEQDERANGHRCWNWFLPENQRRDGPEPAKILALVEEIATTHSVDRTRIFVAGLSAGAALAAALAEQAPDVFSGAGLMAGIALHAAHDVESAYAAMRGELDDGAFLPVRLSRNGRPYQNSRAIVWTGLKDRRVAPGNAWHLGAQFQTLYGLPPKPDVEDDLPDGRRAQWHDPSQRLRLEVRELDGIGHAWSGGSLRGSYTAPAGPNFSEALLRFFLGEAG
jgi:poly(hydroxyalkanoate) depolymerase family esterase